MDELVHNTGLASYSQRPATTACADRVSVTRTTNLARVAEALPVTVAFVGLALGVVRVVA